MSFEFQLVEGRRCLGCGVETKEHSQAIKMFMSEQVIGYLCDECEAKLVAFEASTKQHNQHQGFIQGGGV